MGKDSAYELQWRDLRTRIALFLFCMFLFPVLAVFRVLFVVRPYFVPFAMVGVAGVYFYLVSFRCPRCGELYFRGPVIFRWWPEARNYYLFTSKCLNCSLPKWSPSSN
jgi:hypothetical protein